MSSSPVTDDGPKLKQYECRWDWCRERFLDPYSLRQHVMGIHVEKSVAVPKDSLHIWQSANGTWRGRQKEYTPASRRSPIVGAPSTRIAHSESNNISNQMEVDSLHQAHADSPAPPADISRPASHHLDAYGIPRSQEASVVTQVFSPYVSSSEEQRLQQSRMNEHTHTPVSNPSQTHARIPSNESASLPQSHDYETVQGILPKEVPQPHSSATHQPIQGSGSTTNSDGSRDRTTPLRVGIAFGALPNVSSSSEGSTSTSSTNLFAFKSEKADGKAVGPIGSPNGGKKSSDKSLRFGFGHR